MLAVDASDLVIRYGSRAAVNRLTWQVPQGVIAAIMGANGAGKTSTINAAVGLLAPTSGSIRTLGLDPIAERKQIARSVGVAFQEGGLYPTARPGAFMAHLARLYAQPADPHETLREMGLDPSTKTLIKRLSGGEQKRLSCAAALVGRPTLVFLDEPTAGVDPVGKREIWAALERHRDAGMTIILTSHDFAEVERLADTVMVMRQGAVVLEARCEDLMNTAGGVTISGPAHLDTAPLSRALPAEITVAEVAPGLYRIRGPISPSVSSTVGSWAAQHGIAGEGLTADRGGLEDVVMRSIGGESQ